MPETVRPILLVTFKLLENYKLDDFGILFKKIKFQLNNYRKSGKQFQLR